MEEQEIWKTIDGFSNYQASNLGRIRCKNWWTGKGMKVIKQTLGSNGYLKVNIRDNDNNIKTKSSHRLIGLTFIPNPENKPQINHKNGIKTDNRVINMEWVNQSENQIHAYVNELQSAKGENNSRSKLSEKDVLEIREKFKPKIYTYKMLAEEYNVSWHTIKGIVIKSSNAWSHLS